MQTDDEIHAWGEAEIERLEAEHAAAMAAEAKRQDKADATIRKLAISKEVREAMIDKVEPKMLKAASALFVETTPLKVEIVDGKPQIIAQSPYGPCGVESAVSGFLASDAGAIFAPKPTTPGAWAAAIRKLH